MNPNGRTIGSRSNPQLVFAMVIGFQATDVDDAFDAGSIPGAIAAAIPDIMKFLLFIDLNPFSILTK